MIEEVVADSNFDHFAQAAFDRLTDATDWTWSGLVDALANRFPIADLEELHGILGERLIEAAR